MSPLVTTTRDSHVCGEVKSERSDGSSFSSMTYNSGATKGSKESRQSTLESDSGRWTTSTASSPKKDEVGAGLSDKGSKITSASVSGEAPAVTVAASSKYAPVGCGQASSLSYFPWRDMHISPATWACVAGNVGAATGINVVLSWTPTYLEVSIRVDLEDIGLVAQLSPSLSVVFFSILAEDVRSWLVYSRGTSVASASKPITVIALLLAFPYFFFMGLALSTATGSLLSSLALASAAFSRGGWTINHFEIAAPEYAPMLYSIANCTSATASMVFLIVTGKLLDAFGGGQAKLAWTAAIVVLGIMCGTCGLAYINFCQMRHNFVPTFRWIKK